MNPCFKAKISKHFLISENKSSFSSSESSAFPIIYAIILHSIVEHEALISELFVFERRDSNLEKML